MNRPTSGNKNDKVAGDFVFDRTRLIPKICALYARPSHRQEIVAGSLAASLGRVASDVPQRSRAVAADSLGAETVPGTTYNISAAFSFDVLLPLRARGC